MIARGTPDRAKAPDRRDLRSSLTTAANAGHHQAARTGQALRCPRRGHAPRGNGLGSRSSSRAAGRVGRAGLEVACACAGSVTSRAHRWRAGFARMRKPTAPDSRDRQRFAVGDEAATGSVDQTTPSLQHAASSRFVYRDPAAIGPVGGRDAGSGSRSATPRARRHRGSGGCGPRTNLPSVLAQLLSGTEFMRR